MLISSGAAMNVKVRNTSVQGNGFHGVSLTSTLAGSTLDFGKLGEPGGNTFRSNNASTSGRYNFNVSTASGIVTQAVGNTWVPGIQMADGTGHYATPAGTTKDGTNASAAGVNYLVAPAGAILRLAETAP